MFSLRREETLDFTSLNENFRLLTVAKGRKNISNGTKGLDILQKGEYSHDSADNTSLVCCLRVVSFLELLTCR